MSEHAQNLEEPGSGGSAGFQLRAAREAAGLHIAALAVALKVPVKKLEALEADRFDQLPDVVFVRALAASVCRTLKLDPVPVLEKLPGTAVPRLVPDAAGINAPFRSPRDGPRPGWKDQLGRPVIWVVLALLLGALVLVLFPAADPVDSHVNSAELSPSAGLAQGQAASPPTLATDALATQSVTLAMGSASAPAAASVPATPAPASLSTPAAPAPTPVAIAGSESGLVEFRSSSETWIEVTDAKGQVALRRTLSAGERAGATGPLPLAVVVGKADATQVSVRGKPLDLAPLAKDNVARFEVK